MTQNIAILLLTCICFLPVNQAPAQQDDTQPTSNWRKESVTLPPPFARQVGLKGTARVRFSPGWGKKDTDQFFTYAFVFQTEPHPKYDTGVIQKELLAYYGGLASAVSRRQIDPQDFKLTVTAVKPKVAGGRQQFTGTLAWTEPFFTKKQQTLYLEMQAFYDAKSNKNYLMVGASPQDPRSKQNTSRQVWQELRKVRDSFTGVPSSSNPVVKSKPDAVAVSATKQNAPSASGSPTKKSSPKTPQ